MGSSVENVGIKIEIARPRHRVGLGVDICLGELGWIA
jgi:hypothetical protein